MLTNDMQVLAASIKGPDADLVYDGTTKLWFPVFHVSEAGSGFSFGGSDCDRTCTSVGPRICNKYYAAQTLPTVQKITHFNGRWYRLLNNSGRRPKKQRHEKTRISISQNMQPG